MRQDGVGCREFHQAIDEGSFLTVDQEEHLHQCESCLDWMLTKTLETRKEENVPPDFSKRVANLLPVDPFAVQRTGVASPKSAYGRSIAFASLLVLTVSLGFLPLLPVHALAATSPVWTTLEMLAIVEAGCIAFWLGRDTLSS